MHSGTCVDAPPGGNESTYDALNYTKANHPQTPMHSRIYTRLHKHTHIHTYKYEEFLARERTRHPAFF